MSQKEDFRSEKRYIAPDVLAEQYGIEKSIQAKLRMNKQVSYVRPVGSRVVLYDVDKIEKWMKGWEVC